MKPVLCCVYLQKRNKNFLKKTSSQNSTETVESERKNTVFDKEIPKEIYVSPEER